jgi:dCMP deaminase
MKNKWNQFYITHCEAYASNSKCHSRQIGAILVRDKTIISGGYNGPPRGISHCQDSCPRKAIEGYQSGKNMEICPAVHAEANAIINAAREGVITKGSTLFMNTTVYPCRECTKLIINAGIIKVVVLTPGGYYDKQSESMWFDDCTVERGVFYEY